MTDLELLAPMTAVAHRVGERLLDRRRPVPGATLAEMMAAFSAVDDPASDRLREELTALRPGAAWAAELDTTLPASGEAWVTDPVDGAVQYLQGLSQWCVSITLVRDRVPVAAVLHSPPLGETYAASRGHGATRNGLPVAPSSKTEMAAALVGTSQPPFIGRQPMAARRAGGSLSAVLPLVGAVRNLGATSWQIADTGAGRLDAFWEYGVDDGNLLGGALIAREAGAVVTDTAGNPWTVGAEGFLAATPTLHGRLIATLAGID